METVLKSSLSAAERSLVQMAEDAIDRAHAPVTGVQVGAAVLTAGGAYGGCNVESAVSGLGICAERNAVNHAVLHDGPVVSIVALSVAWKKLGSIRPCGACLQYLTEFAHPEVTILMAAPKALTVVVGRLTDLLPYRYELPPGGR